SKSQVLISSGYGRGTALIEVTKEGDEWQSEQLWLSNRLKSKMSNFVVHDGYAYGLDSGILACVSIEDGKRQWKGGRYGHGQILLVGQQLLIQAESGEVVMVEAAPDKHKELGRFQALDGKTWNHLALAGNILLVRNDHRAAAFELPLSTSSVQ
ncbi:MAG: oxidoreductase, partial [Pirellulaceae bacterium]